MQTPSSAGIEYREMAFTMLDRTVLQSWFLPAVAPAMGTVIFLHGNAENISTHFASVYWLPKQHFNVLLVGYRGYGRSGGTADLSLMHADTKEVILQASALPEIKNSPIILFGQSLGGSIALYLSGDRALSQKVDIAVADSSFASYRTIAAEKLRTTWLTYPFFWLPYLLVDDSFSVEDNLEYLPRDTSVLLLHCVDDPIVSVEHSFQIARQRDFELWTDKMCGHIGYLRKSEHREQFVRWMKAEIARKSENAAKPPAVSAVLD